jgi:hypothetical protein
MLENAALKKENSKLRDKRESPANRNKKDNRDGSPQPINLGQQSTHILAQVRKFSGEEDAAKEVPNPTQPLNRVHSGELATDFNNTKMTDS